MLCVMGRTSGDRGDIILGWLTRLTAVLALFGVLGFDVVSLTKAHFTSEDRAQSAARTAASAWSGTRDAQQAYDAALAEVLPLGDTIDAPTFAVGPDGSVTLTLRTVASTLVVEKVPPIRSWAEVATTVTAAPAP